MKLTLVDIIPRIKRMLKEQRLINTTIWLSIAAGLIEGFALCLLLPCVTALANNEPVWGMGLGGCTQHTRRSQCHCGICAKPAGLPNGPGLPG